jgi:pimeloyl-ACP methyl ester carboxylesterase
MSHAAFPVRTSRLAVALGLAVAVLALPACQQPGSVPTGVGPAADAVKTLPVNGVRLPYVEQGRGVPVVFVHGAMSDHRTWLPHLPLLAGQYRAITYTQRYYGTQVWPEGGPTFGVSTHADDLVAFIRALGSGPVHLVGWSYGANVVLEATRQHPELVRSAFAFEPPFPTFVTDPALLQRIGQDVGASGIPAAAQAAAAGDPVRAEMAMLDAVGERPAYHETLPPSVRRITQENAGTLRAQLVEMPPPPPLPCEELGQWQTPVRIASGGNSRPMFREVADAAARCLPQRKHLVVPGYNHMWPTEDPAGFARAVVTFLKEQ